VAGSSVAHAEINVLSQLRFRGPRTLVLTTTLQPCLQCAAAIRQAPIASVRVGGADPIWDRCAAFGSLNAWVARRAPVPTSGPRRDELGVFARLIARFGPGLVPDYESALRERGDGALVDLVQELESSGWCERARNTQWPGRSTTGGPSSRASPAEGPRPAIRVLDHPRRSVKRWAQLAESSAAAGSHS
jgi:hypothetical protein